MLLATTQITCFDSVTDAAVTFLALGNGAPDISSSIAAVRAGQYKMALGSLLGKLLT